MLDRVLREEIQGGLVGEPAAGALDVHAPKAEVMGESKQVVEATGFAASSGPDKTLAGGAPTSTLAKVFASRKPTLDSH